MTDFMQAFMEVPPFTRYFLTATFLLSFGMTYKLLNPYYLILDFEMVIWKLNVWRLITPFLFAGPFSQ